VLMASESPQAASDETPIEPTQQSKIPQLPTEVLDLILSMLRSDTPNYRKTITTVARVSRSMYALAIPRIYKSVYINKRNSRKIGYGHGGVSTTVDEGMPPPTLFKSQTDVKMSKLEEA
jgi:hypothetical protein